MVRFVLLFALIFSYCDSVVMVFVYRIVWNGNDYGLNATSLTDAEYNAVTPSADWMVENGSVCVNWNLTGGITTILDKIGYVTTPTLGYTESVIGGSDVPFHGPFQRRMVIGPIGSSTEQKRIGWRIHMMRYLSWPTSLVLQMMTIWNLLFISRQFYCAEDASTFSINYQYVYCRSLPHEFQNILYIDVGGVHENYTWYDGEYAPQNSTSSTIDGASSFSTANDSNMFDCVDNSNNAHVVNLINVTYQYSSTVNSADPILIHIFTMLARPGFWFMVGNVEITCTGNVSVCISYTEKIDIDSYTVIRSNTGAHKIAF